MLGLQPEQMQPYEHMEVDPTLPMMVSPVGAVEQPGHAGPSAWAVPPFQDSNISSAPMTLPAGQTRRRIPSDARSALDDWFLSHKDDPYPTKEDLEGLVGCTGLSERQIRTYFANARARKLSARQTASSSRPIQPRRSPGGSVAAQQDVDSLGQNPMERFLSSSPEDEGIPEVAIKNAAASLSLDNAQKHTEKREKSSQQGDTMSVAAESSNSGSASSAASIDSLGNRARRRGRRRQGTSITQQAQTVVRKPSSAHKIFQCTYVLCALVACSPHKVIGSAPRISHRNTIGEGQSDKSPTRASHI